MTEFEIDDVRLKEGFDPTLYPKADGEVLKDGDGPCWERKLLFLSVYYRLNRHYCAMAEARKNGNDTEAASLLESIQVDYDMRQALEQHYAPIGFLGEPEMDGLLVENVVFSHSRLGDLAQPSTVTLSSSIQIPLSPEILADIAASQS